MSRLSTTEERAIFDGIDEDGSGSIEDKELYSHLLDKGLDEQTISELFRRLDTNQDGHISRDEWKSGFEQYLLVAWRAGGERIGDKITSNVHGNGVDCLASTTRGDALLVPGGGDGNPKEVALVEKRSDGTTLVHQRFTGHRKRVTCVASDDDVVASGDIDNTVRLWNLFTGEQTAVLEGHEGRIIGVAVRAFAVDAHGKGHSLVVSGSDDFTVRLWRDAACAAVLIEPSGMVLSVALGGITAGGEEVVLSAGQDSVKVWPIDGRTECLGTLPHPGPVFSIDVDVLDRDVIATGCGGLDSNPESSKVRVWSLSSASRGRGPTCTRVLDPALGSAALSCVNAVRITGDMLVSGQHGCVKVWKLIVGGGECVATLEHERVATCGVVVLPSGAIAAVGDGSEGYGSGGVFVWRSKQPRNDSSGDAVSQQGRLKDGEKSNKPPSRHS